MQVRGPLAAKADRPFRETLDPSTVAIPICPPPSPRTPEGRNLQTGGISRAIPDFSE